MSCTGKTRISWKDMYDSSNDRFLCPRMNYQEQVCGAKSRIMALYADSCTYTNDVLVQHARELTWCRRLDGEYTCASAASPRSLLDTSCSLSCGFAAIPFTPPTAQDSLVGIFRCQDWNTMYAHLLPSRAILRAHLPPETSVVGMDLHLDTVNKRLWCTDRGNLIQYELDGSSSDITPSSVIKPGYNDDDPRTWIANDSTLLSRVMTTADGNLVIVCDGLSLRAFDTRQQLKIPVWGLNMTKMSQADYPSSYVTSQCLTLQQNGYKLMTAFRNNGTGDTCFIGDIRSISRTFIPPFHQSYSSSRQTNHVLMNGRFFLISQGRRMYLYDLDRSLSNRSAQRWRKTRQAQAYKLLPYADCLQVFRVPPVDAGVVYDGFGVTWSSSNWTSLWTLRFR